MNEVLGRYFADFCYIRITDCLHGYFLSFGFDVDYVMIMKQIFSAIV